MSPMRYPPSLLEDIKARLPASLVVGRRVKLLKAGREWKGLSPFNAERTPSFFVNDQKQAWFDFSSGRNGDIFTFLIEVEGISFGEAVEKLAAEAGVALPKFSPEAEQREKERANLHQVMVLAADYFRRQLKEGVGREARSYLTGRGLSLEVIERFGIGFAPASRHGLRDHLAEKDVALDQMIEAGLLIAGDDIPVPYDRFRDRIMFPIMDAKGRVIAFGGRAMQKDAQAKYLNSPETPLFHKGDTLYNLHLARKAVHEAGTIHVVEGYMDVIAMDRAGTPNVVAPMGTALTEDQLAMLWRLAPEPILCFDGDKAGRRAAFRAVDLALTQVQPGRSLRFVFLPEGQDPDDIVRQSGAQALKSLIAQPRPLVDVLFEREIERMPIETPEQRADCEKRLYGAVASIAHEDLKRHYRQAMRERLNTRFAGASRQRFMSGRAIGGKGDQRFSGVRGNLAPWEQPGPMIASDRLKSSAMFRAIAASSREAALILGVIHHPQIIESEAEQLSELILENPAARRLRQALLDCAAMRVQDHAELREDGEQGFVDDLLARGLADELRQITQMAGQAESWAMPGVAVEHALAAWREAAHLHTRQSFLNSEIDQVSDDLAQQGTHDVFERLKVLLQRREANFDAQ
jgi:DNA primase